MISPRFDQALRTGFLQKKTARVFVFFVILVPQAENGFLLVFPLQWYVCVQEGEFFDMTTHRLGCFFIRALQGLKSKLASLFFSLSLSLSLSLLFSISSLLISPFPFSRPSKSREEKRKKNRTRIEENSPSRLLKFGMRKKDRRTRRAKSFKVNQE